MSFNYLILEKQFTEISSLENILNLLNWDLNCNMPIGAQISRNREMMALNQIIKKKLISPTIQQLLLKAQTEIATLDPWQKANLQLIDDKIKESMIIPESLENSLLEATNIAEMQWRLAKKNHDFALFQPFLQKVLDYTKQVARLRSQKLGLSLYDALISQYDRGMTAAEIDQNFVPLKAKLPALLQEILKKQQMNQVVNQPMTMSLSHQKEINLYMMTKMGFDFDYGRLDESLHPFCGGTPYDVRLTTHYYTQNFLNSFFGTIHELGHALYEQNLPTIYKNQPVGQAYGFTFHESQSLLFEKQIAKSPEFLTYLSQFLQHKFPDRNHEFSFINLYQQVNYVRPDFLRIYADEVTYPLHVILRYEIEELLINDRISLAELPAIWDQKMMSYLGIKPPNHAVGCLQDIHWSHGSFGYFPSYLHGNIIAAMIMKKIRTLYPTISTSFLHGDVTQINDYLNTNFRNYGSCYDKSALLQQVTGEKTIQSEVFLQYLITKYL